MGLTRAEAEAARTAGLLESLGISFERHEVPISSIDITRSLHNQARFSALDAIRVEEYTDSIREGHVFPPIVLHRNGGGLYVAVSGNHRIRAALLAGKASIDAYVTPLLDQDEFTVFCFEDNVGFGLSLPRPERIAAAYRLILRGMSIVEAARRLDITRSALQNHVSVVSFDDRAGIELARQVKTQHSKTRLNSIRADATMVRAAQAVAAVDAQVEDVSALCAAINKTRSEASATEIISSWTEDQKTKKRERGDSSVSAIRMSRPFKQIIQSATKVREAAMSIGELTAMPKDQREKAEEALRSLIEQAQEILDALA